MTPLPLLSSAPRLDDVRIASPCSARWEDMVGDERVRHCGQCRKDVFFLSGMTRVEAEALLAARGSSLCARIYRRADGTVLTADCPVGIAARLAQGARWARARAVAAAALLFGALGLAGCNPSSGGVLRGSSLRGTPVIGDFLEWLDPTPSVCVAVGLVPMPPRMGRVAPQSATQTAIVELVNVIEMGDVAMPATGTAR